MGDECRHSTMEVIDGTIHLHDCDRPAGHAVPAVHKDSLSGVTWLELTRPNYGPETARWYTEVGISATVKHREAVDG